MFNAEGLIIYILLIAVVLLIAWLIRLEFKLRRLLGGKKAKDIEEALAAFVDELQSLQKTTAETTNDLDRVKGKLKQSIQHVKTVRFNPFPEQGGNHSFAVALLDEKGNGTVISTLYSRERVGVYAKPIIGRQSEYELSKEEKAAMTSG